jgi:menaquinone-9 beta-reductase
MEKVKVEIVIVGGGLAGLSAALLLQQQGRDVIVIEKGDYPSHKVCGEYISYEAWPFLQQLGIDPIALELPRLKRLRVSAPNGRILESELSVGAYGISRYLLDDLLYKKCIEKGIKVYTNTKVNNITFENDSHQISTNNQIFESTYCMAAYGKRSNLDVNMKRPFIVNASAKNYVGIKYHIKTKIEADVIELHNFENGYCGISRVEGDSVCLCYLTDAVNLKRYKGDIKKMESEILMQNPFLKKYFTESEFLYSEPLVISNVSFLEKQAVENHIFMLGDAAGLIAPLCGNGMSIAFNSSKIVAETFHLYSDRAQRELNYTKSWNQSFKGRLKFGRNIQHLFGSAFISNLVLTVLKPIPFLFRILERKSHGETF